MTVALATFPRAHADATVQHADAAAIRAALDLLVEPDGVVELRIPDAPHAGTVSGYYKDLDKLARDAALANRQYGTTYITLNPPNAALLARAANRHRKWAKTTTSDSDVVRRRWALIDTDPRRPADISSTDAEHRAALERAAVVQEALSAVGWPAPIVADSGNGGHLLYRVDLPNDDESRRLLETVLNALAFRFDDAVVVIDQTTFNASRITKLYGTVAMKGDHTADRPHRLAHLLDVPGELVPSTREQLATVAAWLPAQPTDRRTGYQAPASAFDLDGWLATHNVPVVSTSAWNGGRKYLLNPCPWNPEHTNRAAYIVQLPNGAIAAGCQHNGCVGKDWHDLRTLCEPEPQPSYGEQHRNGHTAAGTATHSIVAPDDVLDHDDERAAAGPALPAIVVTGRELRDKTTQALDALRAANARIPTLFERAGQLCRVQLDESGRPRIELLDADRMRSRLARVADWLAFDRRTGEHKHVSPSADVAADLLVVGTWGLAPLTGISELPPLRADGSIGAAAGYDPDTSLYYAPAAGFTPPRIPLEPAPAEVRAATAALLDVIADFPFVDQASRAAAVAAIITPILRPTIAGNVPIFLFDKPKAGTGASLLADVVAMITSGRPAAMQAIADDEVEFDKRILASLADGSPLLVFDNADAPLQSGALSRLVTAATYRGRILGHSRMVEYPQRATVLVTGNNIKLRGDIARRSIWCRLDARLARPWERAGWRHPQLLAWVREHRAGLVAAALTLARAWIIAGRPDGSVKPLGSFEAWTRTLGGILAGAGIDGFLANLRELYEQADAGATQWAAFLGALADQYGADSFSSAAVAALVQAADSPLRSALPDDLAGALDKPRLQNAIGTAFGQRVETRFERWRLVRAGTHARATLWAVASDPEPGPGPGESVSHGESLSACGGGNAAVTALTGSAFSAPRPEADSFASPDSPARSPVCYWCKRPAPVGTQYGPRWVGPECAGREDGGDG